MATSVDVLVKLLGDTSNFRGSVKSAQKDAATFSQKMQALGGVMQSVGKKMTVGLTLPIVAGMGIAVKSASDLGESVNAVNVTFGKASKGIIALGKDAATAVGMSATEFNGLAVQFSNFAKTVAGPGGDVVKTMDDLTTRAADFASVMNIDVAKAAEIFQSGLAGESEPLRKYGIDVSAAAVQAYAWANGIAKSGKELTEAQKVQARYGLIMEQTKKTQGDFANTSDSLANRSRILKAQLGNVSAQLGTVLLPVIESVANRVGDLVEWVAKLSPGWKEFAVKAALVVAAIGPMLMITGKLLTMIPLMTSAFRLLNTVFITSPIGLIVLGIVALVAAFVYLWKKCDWFRNFWIGLWENIKVIVSAFWDWAGPFIKASVEAWWTIIKTVFNAIVDLVNWLWPLVKKAAMQFWDWAGPFIKASVEAWWTIIKAVFKFVVAGFKTTWKAVSVVVKWFWGWAGPFIKASVKAWWAIIKATFNAIVAVVKWAWPYIVKIVKTNIAAIKGFINGLKTVVGVVRTVWNAVRDVTRSIWNKIGDIVGGAYDRIKGFVNKIIGAINWVIQKVPGIDAKPIPLLGGSSSSSKSSSSGAKATVSTPRIMNNGGMGGPVSSGIGAASNFISGAADWVKDLWGKFDISSHLPKPFGGLFGGASNVLLDLAKDAIVGLLKKSGGGVRQQIVNFAKSQIGVPYLWGGTSPAGFDCSGLPYWAYAQAGKSIPRIPTYGGKQISRGQIQPADIMFYYPGAMQEGHRVPFGHFKMYAGNNQTVESASGGVQVRTADWAGAAQIRSYMALGGITRGLTIAGEAGPEAVIPLTRPNRAAQVLAEAGLLGGGGNTVVKVYIDGREVTNRVVQRIATAKRRTARGIA